MDPDFGTHMRDAAFHLKNAAGALERAADTAPTGNGSMAAQQAAALTRRLQDQALAHGGGRTKGERRAARRRADRRRAAA